MASTDPARAIERTPTVKLNTGYTMPLLGLGTSGLSGDACTKAVSSALRLGFRHIDSAQMYGNEEAVGAAVGPALQNGLKRDDLFLVTKLGNDKHEPSGVISAMEESLRKLQVSYVDLCLIHWPMMPEKEKETWAELEKCVNKGWVRSIGISNFSPEKTDKWFSDAKIFPAVNQCEVHPMWKNDRLLEYAKKHGVHVTAYAPMSSPATMASQGREVPNLLKDERITSIASRLGKTPAQVLLRWGLQHGTSVIPRSGSEEHQKDILDTVEFELSKGEYDGISNMYDQIKFFPGDNIAIGKGKPYTSYEDLWDEKPTKLQKLKDYT